MAFKIADFFDLTKKERIKESNTIVYFYEHKKTKAKVIYFQNENESASFGTFFKTPEENSKGTTHILEHMVFEGSKNFDQQNAIEYVFNNTLTSFANAFTYPDKTIYLFSSSFQKDYINLMDIYLDFVYFPKLEEKALKKEGHFYKKTEQGYEFNGIVFNEMKNSLLGFNHQRFYASHNLFHPGSYSLISGGDPVELVDLEIEELRNYHKDKYHPSNSHTIIYGKVNKNLVFSKLNSVFSEFEFEEKNFEIKAVPVGEDKRMNISYQEIDGDNKFVKYYLIKGMKTEEDFLGLDIFKKYYFDYDFSPLRREIEDSGLCNSFSASLDDEIKYPILIISCDGVEDKNIEILEELIDKCMFKYAKKISTEHKSLLFKSYEYLLKEIEFSQNQGRDIVVSCAKFLNYGLDPLIGLRNFKSLKIIEKLLKGNKLEKFISNNILTSQTLSIKFTPKDNLLIDYEKMVQNKLEKKLKLIDTKELDKQIEEHEKYLNREKIEPKYSNLKKLKIQDLDLKIKKFDTELVGNSLVTYLNCSNLIRLNLNFDISDFNFSKIEYLGIYLNIVNQLSSNKYNFQDFSYLKSNHLARILFETDNYYNKELGKKLSFIVLNLKFLDNDSEKVLEILKELILNLDFEDKIRIKFLLTNMLQNLKFHLVEEPLYHAFKKATSHFSEFEYLDYNFNSLPIINKLKFILDNFDTEFEALVSELRLIHNYIFTQNCVFSAGIAKENKEFFNYFSRKISDEFNILSCDLNKLGSLKINGFKLPDKNLNFFLPVNSDTNFNVMAVKYKNILDKDQSVIRYLVPYLDQYLWENIRNKNGAYSVGFSFIPNCNNEISIFSTASDPKINETFDTFSNTRSNFSLSKFKKYSFEKMKLRFLSNEKRVLQNEDIFNLSFVYYITSKNIKIRESELNSRIALNYNGFKELFKNMKNIQNTVKVVACSLQKIKDFKEPYERIS